MLEKNREFSALHSLSNEMFGAVTAPDFSFSYDSEERVAVFNLPESVLLGDSLLFAIDNNTNFDDIDFYGREDNIFAFTSGAIVQESHEGILASKVDLVCGSDLYEPTKDRWEDPINVRILNSGTGGLYDEFLMKLNKSTNNIGFSSWVFTSTRSDGRSTVMLIKQGALNPNSFDRRGDLSLLALVFIFKTASLSVKSFLSNDKHTKDYDFQVL